MATQNTYTGNGSTTAYSFTFPYLETTDIKVSLNAVDTTAYSLTNATTVNFNSAPASGVAIRIYRNTDTSNLKATFFPGSAIKASDLNDNFTQNLYVTQEADFDVDTANTLSNTAITTANNANSTATTANTNANTALSTANAANVASTNASQNATAAVTTANTALATANTAESTANTASSNINTAVNTANTASTNAATALSTANTANTNATSALNNSRESDGSGGFVTAIAKANTATTTANSANTSASSAVTTANTASTNASSALSTANTANTNATTALNNSRESDGSGGFNSAIDKANTAITTANSASTSATSAVSTANTASTNASNALSAANAATAAVSAAGLSTNVANVSAIPGSPSNNDLVEVVNSTGIQSFTPLSGIPSGFTGASTLTVRIKYDSSASSWVWASYFNNDSEATYLKKSTPVVVGDSTNGSGQITLNCENNSHGVKIKGPPHSAAATYTLTLPNNTGSSGQALVTNGSGVTSWGNVAADLSTVLALSGGTMTGALTLSGAPTSNLHAASKLYVDNAVPDISGKANLASPTFTGVPAGPTASSGSNTTQLATTAFVTAAVPDISGKANTASPTFTGTPAAPTAASGTNTTQLATTAFVTAAVAAGGGSSTPSVIDPGNFDNGTSLVSSSNTIDAGDFD